MLSPEPLTRHLVFLYGTLMHGESRHGVLKAQTFLGEATTQPNYRLLHLGSYPGLIDAYDQGHAIAGEVWEVDERCLARLDRIEAVDEGLYERKQVRLTEEFAQPVESYFYLGETDDCDDCGTRWR